ncbi:IucA/IucC family protein [Halobacillus mangrovi]|uniref:IucA/IucC family siderophore biosynthesis protein n=1 Tax=Halobacillus mangrovi TaxID=402384 RepID=A0A1W5ZTI9_9BACI|nr:IucA/IucC family protein [Halobacillus mangrovi]ARI76612.1 IucA/IucC family siderophore biosynthesis protein [Halobacillus mangrovi]
MNHAKEIAEQATMQSFLNCYLRETGNFEKEERYPQLKRESSDQIIRIDLNKQQTNLFVPVNYESLTGRHLFSFPFYYRIGKSEEFHTLDYVTMTTLLTKEWLVENKKSLSEDELLLRVILSCKKIRTYVEKCAEDRLHLTNEQFDFIEAEQSLLFGHLLHPTPKSKQGLTDKEDEIYSPEQKGEFQLHYFAAKPSIVDQDSSIKLSASEIIFEDVKDFVGQARLQKLRQEERVLIPVHPLQVPVLLEQESVQKLLTTGELEDVGQIGRKFTATSSFRTVYSSQSKYMYKFSVPVKITNSLRVNQRKELARGVEVSRLLDTTLGEKLKKAHPHFRLIKDPAYINVLLDKEISGFEVVLRENPFYTGNTQQASVIAGLVQDSAYGEKSRLYSIIRSVAAREGRSHEEVSLDWFNRYLTVTLDPVLWLFCHYGIALEAHQQNSIIQLNNGYPEYYYYRDNQGYYFCESKADQLKSLVPALNKESDTVCKDEVAEERLRYYFFFNHLFGLINGFGTSGLIQEDKLMDVLRERIKLHPEMRVTNTLLKEEELPCKANLLTRFYDMDELVGPMESQSVYTQVPNPLAVKEEAVHG